MKIGVMAGIGGIGILILGVVASLGWFSSTTADFAFPVTDGKGTMTYRCQMKETLAETEENARAAHALFEPVLTETARVQAKAMAAAMSPGRSSSEVAAELEALNTEFEASLKAVHFEFQQQFGCDYRGST